ncbi:MAG: FeoB-associated Cys-rich membrane protein [Acetatifactor sp.]
MINEPALELCCPGVTLHAGIQKGVAMENLIVVGILLVLVGAATLYIWKERKKGTRCIGCPAAGRCSGRGCGNAKES